MVSYKTDFLIIKVNFFLEVCSNIYMEHDDTLYIAIVVYLQKNKYILSHHWCQWFSGLNEIFKRFGTH
jgi:hypothetical protein